MFSDRIIAQLYILTLRILLAWQTISNRLRGILLPDRRAPIQWHTVDDRRVTPPITPRQILPYATAAQMLAFILTFAAPTPAILQYFTANLLIVGLALLPLTLRPAPAQS